jgi:hypothetical protein
MGSTMVGDEDGLGELMNITVDFDDYYMIHGLFYFYVYFLVWLIKWVGQTYYCPWGYQG